MRDSEITDMYMSFLCMLERDPHRRPQHLQKTLSSLHSSLETFPTPSVYHHLALAYARPSPAQDIQEAIKHARAAVEGDPSVSIAVERARTGESSAAIMVWGDDGYALF